MVDSVYFKTSVGDVCRDIQAHYLRVPEDGRYYLKSTKFSFEEKDKDPTGSVVEHYCHPEYLGCTVNVQKFVRNLEFLGLNVVEVLLYKDCSFNPENEYYVFVDRNRKYLTTFGIKKGYLENLIITINSRVEDIRSYYATEEVIKAIDALKFEVRGILSKYSLPVNCLGLDEKIINLISK